MYHYIFISSDVYAYRGWELAQEGSKVDIDHGKYVSDKHPSFFSPLQSHDHSKTHAGHRSVDV